MDKIRQNVEIEVGEKNERLRMMRVKSIDEVLEEVNVLIDTHFFNEFEGTKSSQFLKKCCVEPEFDRHEPPQEDLEDSQLLS